MAKRLEVPVCPHAGGVGLCEYVNHLVMVDAICVAGTTAGRLAEYVDHLHEHFEDPPLVRNAAYLPPVAHGYGITMKPASLERFRYPDGPVWSKRLDASTAEGGP